MLNSGDALFGSTVSSFSLGSTGLDGNEIAFSYSLASGVSGIATVQTAAVPEPSSYMLLGITAAVAFCGWRFNRRRKSAAVSQ